MKTPFVLLMLWCVVNAKPLEKEATIVNYDAGSHARYETGQPGQRVVGNYKWSQGDQHYVMSYEADDRGYRPRLTITRGDGAKFELPAQKPVAQPAPVVAIAAADKPEQVQAPVPVAQPAQVVADVPVPVPEPQPAQVVADVPVPEPQPAQVVAVPAADKPEPAQAPVQETHDAIIVSSDSEKNELINFDDLPEPDKAPEGAILTEDAVIVDSNPAVKYSPGAVVADPAPAADKAGDEEQVSAQVRGTAYVNALYDDYMRQVYEYQQQEQEAAQYLQALQRAGILSPEDLQPKDAGVAEQRDGADLNEQSLEAYLRQALEYAQLQQFAEQRQAQPAVYDEQELVKALLGGQVDGQTRESQASFTEKEYRDLEAYSAQMELSRQFAEYEAYLKESLLAEQVALLQLSQDEPKAEPEPQPEPAQQQLAQDEPKAEPEPQPEPAQQPQQDQPKPELVQELKPEPVQEPVQEIQKVEPEPQPEPEPVQQQQQVAEPVKEEEKKPEQVDDDAKQQLILANYQKELELQHEYYRWMAYQQELQQQQQQYQDPGYYYGYQPNAYGSQRYY